LLAISHHHPPNHKYNLFVYMSQALVGGISHQKWINELVLLAI